MNEKDVSLIVTVGCFFGIFLIIAFCGIKQAEPAEIPVNTILLEARGEGLDGMLGVANVIRMRMKERHLTADQVCMQPKQFSCYNDGYREAHVSKEVLDTAIKSWQRSYFEYEKFNANLYCRYDCFPSWRFSPKVKFIKRIKNHLFFKEEIN